MKNYKNYLHLLVVVLVYIYYFYYPPYEVPIYSGFFVLALSGLYLIYAIVLVFRQGSKKPKEIEFRKIIFFFIVAGLINVVSIIRTAGY